MNYFLLTFDRKNEQIDSEELRRDVIYTLLQQGGTLSSNEESSVFIQSQESFDFLKDLLSCFQERMYLTFVQVMTNANKPVVFIEENHEHRTAFKNLVRNIELSAKF